MSELKVYIVEVDTGGTAHSYETHNDDIFQNLKYGNESMIFFKTLDDQEVAIPTRFLVTHKEKL